MQIIFVSDTGTSRLIRKSYTKWFSFGLTDFKLGRQIIIVEIGVQFLLDFKFSRNCNIYIRINRDLPVRIKMWTSPTKIRITKKMCARIFDYSGITLSSNTQNWPQRPIVLLPPCVRFYLWKLEISFVRRILSPFGSKVHLFHQFVFSVSPYPTQYLVTGQRKSYLKFMNIIYQRSNSTLRCNNGVLRYPSYYDVSTTYKIPASQQLQ